MPIYNKQTWVARQRQYADRVTLTPTGGLNEFDKAQVEGTVTVNGTPFNVARMNYMENGIEAVGLVADLGQFPLIISASATDTYVATDARIPAYTDGLTIIFKPTVTANTGNCSLNINGLGGIAFRRYISGAVAILTDNDLIANNEYICIYNASLTAWMVVNPSTAYVERNTTDTLTNKTLTAAKLASGGFLADANGNELLKAVATVASAVNEVEIANSATGQPVGLNATGGDANIGFNINTKGASNFTINSVAVTPIVSDILSSNYTNATTSYTQVTGFQHAVTAGKNYRLQGEISYTRSTNGAVSFSVYLSSGTGTIVGESIVLDNGTGALSPRHLTAIGAVGLAGSTITNVQSVTTAQVFAFTATFKCATTGVITFAGKADTASTTLTVLAGSAFTIQELA